MNEPQPDSTRMFELTPEVAGGSFQAIQRIFRGFREQLIAEAGTIAHTTKGDGSPVTTMDVVIERALLAELAQQFPGLPVFGEETGYDSDLPGAFWLIDPIDGTQSFIDNVAAFTCMAVLIQGGETIASVIYNPSTDALYTAQAGKGAYKNQTRLDLANLPLPHAAYAKEAFGATLNDIMRPHGVICEKGPEGGGHGFAMVAEGVVAARFNLQSRGQLHDYAPGALLVREAGGCLLPVLDDTYSYASRSFIACHPALERTLREHLQAIRGLETQ